ncbi:rhamnogalacturonan acetylesterase [Pedobacter sp. L105]|uniref:rhamnogalacturonan acetylesterase n=1 Tax=Pedobacter sp. L105 TaxID=1641871 RepID=UPI00131D9928|nr:rhamnogalacturonan acetylesterase [Pedobacter sp. L105]
MNCRPLYLLTLLLVLSSFSFPEQHKITVWLIGDSTMAIKDPKTYPETGWGMPFVNFFDSTVVVDNRAKNGRSTRSFIKEGLWKPVTEKMQEGDYVLIQFGHNDEVKTKKTYTTEAEFQGYLEEYVSESRLKKAIPVLVTPVARRSFDASGKIQETHAVYAEIVRKVALEQKVALIDLDKDSQVLLQSFGEEGSKNLFNQLAPGEHPNYPEGRADNTHFNELGARRMAELVLAEIRTQHLGLESRIIKPKTH